MTTATQPSVTAPATSPRQDYLCPYLGLHRDPSVVARFPTESHVCAGPKKKHRPSLEHQAAYCLGPDHGQCPFYAEPDARHMPHHAARAVRSRSRFSVRLVSLGMLVVLMAAVALLVGRRPLQDLPWFNANLEATPAATAPLALSATLAATVTPEPATGTAPTAAPEITAPEITAPELTTPEAIAALVTLPTVTPTPARDESGSIQMASVRAQEPYFTPTPESGGTVHTLRPPARDVGWWASGNEQQRQVGDSFLYAGQFGGQSYVSAVRFDLRRVARGAPIRSAMLRLAGLRSQGITSTTPNRWLVQFVAESNLPDLATDFLTVYSAPAAITLLPELQPGDLDVDRVNQWALDANVLRWLEQQLLDGATSFTVRLMASSNGDNALFAWDSGSGSESKYNVPTLVLSAGAPPPTPPPLPTQALLVATLTPLPANAVTAVAQFATATAEAIVFGTPTPEPYSVVTPTPYPENLATVQANAIAAGLPAVVLDTPVPANAATAEANTAYATAVAMTTGTFTPVPTGYVTPALLYPAPPPENVATAAARVVIATAQAQSGVPVATRPWNGVDAIYVYATATPASAETAIAMIQAQNAAAVTTGTPTPTPWNLVVITAVPEPTATLIPLIVPADQLEPTPTPTPTPPVNAQDLDQFRGKILFLSDRTGPTETWALDPATGQLSALVRDSRLHELARERYLPMSPDGSEEAIVQEDDSQELEIKIYSTTYGTTRQVTNFRRASSYDPAWSPLGDLIAFVSTVTDGDEIYVVDPQGQTVTRLTYNAWEWDKHPTWSPDGSQIAFYSNRETGRRQIWVMNADGSNPRNLTNDEFENWDPVWVR